MPTLLALLAACERARPVYVPAVVTRVDESPIWIGEFGSWSGPDANTGFAEHRGFQLAVDTANEKGGVRGRPLRVYGYDDRSRVDDARKAGERLAADKAVLILGGTTRERAQAAAQSAGDVPLVSVHDSAYAPEGTEIAAMAAKKRAGVLAWYAVRQHQAPRVTVLVRPGVASDRANVDAFAAAVRELGSTTLEEMTISAENIGAVAASLGARTRDGGPPPLVYIACSGLDAAQICRIVRLRDSQMMRMTAGPPDVRSLPLAEREALIGVLSASTLHPRATGGVEMQFQELYWKRYDDYPADDAYLGYIAGLRAVAALANAREYWAADVRAAIGAEASSEIQAYLVRVENGVLVSFEGSRP